METSGFNTSTALLKDNVAVSLRLALYLVWGEILPMSALEVSNAANSAGGPAGGLLSSHSGISRIFRDPAWQTVLELERIQAHELLEHGDPWSLDWRH